MDVVANMLTTILNAQRVNKERVALRYSKFKESLARMLQERGLISAVRIQGEGAKAKLILTLAYENKEAKIQDLRRVSKPGLRRYADHSELPYMGGRPGFFVVSTSQGLMDHEQARKEKVGGELICEVHIN